MTELCTELGYVSINKRGEQLCGDRVRMAPGDDNAILVLADGLGSGVKANILSTLTSTILCTMLEAGLSIEDSIDTIIRTLPVCKTRGVAYSTFCVVRVTGNHMAEMIQFDCPPAIVLRGGRRYDYPVSTRTVEGKQISESRFEVEPGDVFITMSDGAPYAGIGTAFNHGWERDNIVDFAEANYFERATAQYVAANIVDECNRLYGYEPGDDTTVAVLRVRTRQPVSLMIGPPADRAQDAAVMARFFSEKGEKIVCGGTTSALAAKYLNKPLVPTIDYFDPEVPPISHIEGVDLVTEGVITMARVLEIAGRFLKGEDLEADWMTGHDGASQVARMLIERATDINFFVGRAINPAHQNPDLPINFGIKLKLIETLADCLTKMGKRIKVSYC
ncbi:SpoIIE family protein phosphatase [Bacillota bacterium Meth-B3]